MWEFWIDVGGTFTDCIAQHPDGHLICRKVLSNGVTKGQIDSQMGPTGFVDARRTADAAGFWVGFGIRFLNAESEVVFQSAIHRFESGTGAFEVSESLPIELPLNSSYELFSDEEAPLIAIRSVLGLSRNQRIPSIKVRLGTTRGTNALLTRTGARVAFVTTLGFADTLRIGNQDRPRLFDLAIKKPEALYESVIEIDERIDAQGNILRSPDPGLIRRQFEELKSRGIESLAICLLNSFAYPDHELIVARIAAEAGFHEISVSSQIAPRIKIVSRSDTSVVDAYLNPIVRRYLQSIHAKLESSEPFEENVQSTVNSADRDESGGGFHRARSEVLRMMTSSGGLVSARDFRGIDSILSGPAGGVIGFSKIAMAMGFNKAIGFDMGGTSTDVSRFDGEYQLEFESTKAGVRLVTPMLAIETVAAGGGSVCRFDGIKLTVGPESAGADPGPACYGRGGPLTVTDANLFLGRLLPDQFPFPLDQVVVKNKLHELCAQIAMATGKTTYSLHQLAEGIVKISNENMVRPIRSISIAQGYDPRDYVLVAFGSAAGQHACAIARELGIHQIISHPLAGLLSAFGIGMADVRRHAEKSILVAYSASRLAELEPVFRSLESSCRSRIQSEGIASHEIQKPVRSLDLRYRGVEASLNIPEPVDGDYRQRYERLHQTRYGYTHTGREIEIVTARVELTACSKSCPKSLPIDKCRSAISIGKRNTWFDGHLHSLDVYTRESLRPGDEIAGPAIICEPVSTLVIDPDFVAIVYSQGEILISRRRDASVQHLVATPEVAQADPIQLELFNNQFASIAEQMGQMLKSTAFSTNVKERLDFSCALFSAAGHLVVNAPHIPVHLGAMEETVRCILRDNPAINVGDVFVTNDPYRGGSHLPDVTVVTPIHDRQTGNLSFFTASRAHHAEIGGISPGSMPPFSRRLSDEGVLIRNFKLVESGHSNESLLDVLLRSGPHPSRSVRDNLADVAAQVAANQSGADALARLVERQSWPIVESYMRHIQVAAERKTRTALSLIPDGVYCWTDHLDDGSPLKVTITIVGDSASVDFMGTGPVLPGNLNANRAIVTAAVLYVFRCLIDEEIPLNSGVLAPITINIPECFLNPPEQADPSDCAAMVGGNVETSQRIVDVLLGALGLAAASQGTMNNLTFGDGSFGYYETICGGSGATQNSDGADAVHTHMTNTRLTDVEVLEWRYPVRVREFRIRGGSGGSGQFCGGDGVCRRLEFLRPLVVSLLSERRGPYAPFGLQGGSHGAIGKNTLQRGSSGHVEQLGGKVQITVQAGDILTIETPGGGGFGQAVSLSTLG